MDSNGTEALVDNFHCTAIHGWALKWTQPSDCTRQLSVDPDIVLIAERDIFDVVRGFGKHFEVALGGSQALAGGVRHPAVSGAEFT